MGFMEKIMAIFKLKKKPEKDTDSSEKKSEENLDSSKDISEKAEK